MMADDFAMMADDFAMMADDFTPNITSVVEEQILEKVRRISKLRRSRARDVDVQNYFRKLDSTTCATTMAQLFSELHRFGIRQSRIDVWRKNLDTLTRRVPGFAPRLLLSAPVEYWVMRIIEGTALSHEAIVGEALISAEGGSPSQNREEGPLQPATSDGSLGGSNGGGGQGNEKKDQAEETEKELRKEEDVNPELSARSQGVPTNTEAPTVATGTRFPQSRTRFWDSSVAFLKAPYRGMPFDCGYVDNLPAGEPLREIEAEEPFTVKRSSEMLDLFHGTSPAALVILRDQGEWERERCLKGGELWANRGIYFSTSRTHALWWGLGMLSAELPGFEHPMDAKELKAVVINTILPPTTICQIDRVQQEEYLLSTTNRKDMDKKPVAAPIIAAGFTEYELDQAPTYLSHLPEMLQLAAVGTRSQGMVTVNTYESWVRAQFCIPYSFIA
jgi:hypothetical protein